MNQSLAEQFGNVPNRISTIRLLLSFSIFALIPLGLYVPALIVFVIAAGQTGSMVGMPGNTIR